MMTNLNLFFGVCMIAIIAGFLGDQRRRREAREHLHEEFLDNLAKATANRRKWLTDHSYYTNPFEVEEYKKLWRLELGAEELLFLYFPSTWRTRWKEYVVEEVACKGK